jgi:hypothetical protein
MRFIKKFEEKNAAIHHEKDNYIKTRVFRSQLIYTTMLSILLLLALISTIENSFIELILYKRFSTIFFEVTLIGTIVFGILGQKRYLAIEDEAIERKGFFIFKLIPLRTIKRAVITKTDNCLPFSLFGPLYHFYDENDDHLFSYCPKAYIKGQEFTDKFIEMATLEVTDHRRRKQ